MDKPAPQAGAPPPPAPAPAPPGPSASPIGASIVTTTSPLVPKPSFASIQSTESAPGSASGLTAKPSVASLASTKGLLGASAPIAGWPQARSGGKGALEDVPESPASPGEKRWAGLGPKAKAAVSPGAAAGSGPGKGPAGQGGAAAATAAKEQQGYKTRIGTFLRVFTYTSAGERIALALTVIMAMGSGSITPITSIVFGRLVTAVTSFYSQNLSEESIAREFTMEVRECVLYMLYLFVGKFIFTYFSVLGFRTISLRISANIRHTYLTTLLSLPVSTLDLVPPGRPAFLITHTANTLRLGTGEKLSNLLTSISLIITAVAIAFAHSWKLTLVAGAGLVVVAGTYLATVPYVMRGMRGVEEADGKGAGVSGEAFGMVRMVKALGAEEGVVERYGRLVGESRRKGVGIAKVIAIQQGVVFFTIYATFALAFFFAIKLYLNSEIPNVGSLIIVLMSVMMVTMTITTLAPPITAILRSSLAATVLFTTIDLPLPPTSGKKPPGDEVSAAGDIVLTNVNFTYPQRHDVKVLAGVNLRIPAGKTTAIVGPSGSGKSTIVGLVERWYDLDGDWKDKLKIFLLRNGRITCGGVDLKDMDLKWWRSQIGLVQQEPFLFDDTIQRNIEHGLVGTQWEHESAQRKTELVKEACREAFADEFIARLPDGLQTNVGPSGLKLSTGQRQRLSLARALIRHPSILILDEATSSLDSRSEQVVQAALDRAASARGRTTISIAHRLSTVRRADKIVVLAAGKIVQEGTHEGLMAEVGGAYWKLATAQRVDLQGGPGGPGPSPLGAEVGGARGRSMDIMESEESMGEKEKDGGGEGAGGGFFASFGTLIVEQGRERWRWYAVLVFGVLIAGASPAVQAFLFANVLSGFYLTGEYLRDWVAFWCLMFTALAGAVGLGYFTLAWAATTLAFDITATYRKQYFRNLIAKPIPYHDLPTHTPTILTTQTATDPPNLQQLLGTNTGFLLISVLSITGCVALSLYFGWKLALASLAGSLPLILAAGFLRLRYEARFERENREVFEGSARFAMECVGACRTVSSLGMEAGILRRYRTLLGAQVEGAWRKGRWGVLIVAASDGVPLLCMAFVLWYGGRLLAAQEYYPFQYLVVYIAIVQGGIGAGQWLSFAPNIAQATAAANRILASRDLEPGEESKEVGDSDKAEEAAAREVTPGAGAGGARIEFSNVWFRYPARDAPVLSGLDLMIEKGQFAAVVGPSGKTSIISLLERFYTPNAGSITYNGTDISATPLPAHRARLSLVSQEPHLFTGTIRDNILAGLPHARHNPSDFTPLLHSTCEAVGLHSFVVSLPNGYDTLVGPHGVLLSGGQRQRISLARALVREPEVLLLDEATANLDAEAEKSVRGVVEGMRGARTVVVVAHRLASVQGADMIFVLGEGGVVEKGTPAELLARKGVFYRMCLAQALDQ
ncbi:related to multidrug resistance protein [Cephalotrichum gorgonifer]|uniref:Related to multidrug resistance protein n=1 Tax=Cephalotrichum gorgonifer TaxID=2041049 RepID=A0AAE8STM4_9PEZI|nr:related to multidrug resistance protein [Cephalotrichum gorgonifer]